MAKSKNSKILAMALCASVMAGIYASPVMAAEQINSDNNYSSVIANTNGTIDFRVWTTQGDGSQNLARIASFDADGFSIHNGSGRFPVFYIGRHNGDFMAAGGDFAVDAGGNVTANGTLRVAGGDFTVDGDGNVVSLGNVTSTDGIRSYDLNTIGANTAGIRREGDENSGGHRTIIEEQLVVNKESGVISNKNASFTVDSSGNLVASTLGNNSGTFGVNGEGAVKAANGAFTVDKNGNTVSKGDVTSTAADGTTTYTLNTVGEKTAGITQYKNDTTYFKGAVNVEGSIYSKYGKFVIGEDSATYLAKGELNLGAEDGQTLTADKLSTINSVITDKGEVKSQGDVTSYDAKNDKTNSLNKVASNLNKLEGSVGDIGDNVKHVKHYDEFAIGDNAYDATVIEDSVAITNERGIDVIGDNGTSMAVITKDGVARFGDNEGPNVRLDNGDLEIRSNEWTTTAVIRNDGTARFGADADKNIRMVDGVLSINSEGTNAVASLSEEGLMLSDEQSRSQTLNATDIADIKGIDRDIVEETFGDVTTTTKTTTIEGALKVSDNGFISNANESFTVDANGTLTAAGGRFTVSDVTGAHFYGSDSMFSDYTNINGGRIEINGADGSQTVITGNSITTETLNVENIKLGNSMTDKDGNTITIGAAGVIDIEKDGNTVFRADTDNFEAHYDNYDLTLDGTNGFALSNETSSFTLNGNGFAFAGPVHLGNGTQVKFSHNGTDISLSSLVNRVENLEQKTQGISFDETTGSTTIADKVGTDGVESNNSMTVGNNGTTFENGTDSKTNINGGAIDADSSSIGNDVSGGSGSGSSGMTGNGTYTNGSEHSGHFVDKDSSYKFTNDANGFTGTVTDGKHTTTIENVAMGSNTTVKGDNASASSGVGIGNDGAFISDSVTNGDISHTVNGGSITDTVTNGDMTVTEVKDENGSATTVKDANGSSTVSQDRNGQTVSTGTGTSVNTGNDFSVTDNETGKSIYMSDIGHVEDIDSEIQNSDGSKTTVVDAVNNEAEIRRNEIERVDGRINNLENRVGELEDRIDKVGAMAAAIANLRTMGYDPAAPTEVAVGIGQYRDETGAALGLFHYPNRDFMLSLSVSTSGDEVMGGIGATWKFGRKSPEKVAEIKKAQAEADVRRAEEAKLAKAEEMKQAAKEAKIKAQQERHAKLAAERAAQAEAAK